MPITHCFDYCSFVVGFEIRMCESSNFVLFQGCVGYSVFLAIPCELWGWLFHVCKKDHWNFFSLLKCFIFLAMLHGLWDLCSPPGIEPAPPVVEAQSLKPLDRQGSPRVASLWMVSPTLTNLQRYIFFFLNLSFLPFLLSATVS